MFDSSTIEVNDRGHSISSISRHFLIFLNFELRQNIATMFRKAPGTAHQILRNQHILLLVKRLAHNFHMK